MHRIFVAAVAALTLAGCSLPGPFRPFPEAPNYNYHAYDRAFMLMAQQAMVTELAGPDGWRQFRENVRAYVPGRTPESRGDPPQDGTPACTPERLARYIEDPDQPCLTIAYMANDGCRNRDLCASFQIPAEFARRASVRALITEMLENPCAALTASGVTYPDFRSVAWRAGYVSLAMRPEEAFMLLRCREGRRVYGRAVQSGEGGHFQLSFALE